MDISYIVLLLSFLMGPALGSFFAAMVMRMEKLTKASGPYSVDDRSGERLKWFELIPVISFLGLRGKSRYTGKKLDIRMFLAEVLGLLVFGILALGGLDYMVRNSLSGFEFLIFYLIIWAFTTALYFLAVYDLFTYSIPAVITMYITLAAVVLNILIGAVRFFNPEFLAYLRLGDMQNLLAGVVAASFIWLIIYFTKQKGMGEGDVFIAIIMGVMLGWGGLVAGFYVTVFTATLVGLIFMTVRRKLKGLIIPLVPFMTLGFVAGAMYGSQIVNSLFMGI